MTALSYQTTCPKCGAQLQPVALGPHTAPWLCAGCHRGFWACELSSYARSVYRSDKDDWGFGQSRQSIQTEVEVEQSQALLRGTSLREDQIGVAHVDVITSLANRMGIAFSFASLLKAELVNRGNG